MAEKKGTATATTTPCAKFWTRKMEIGDANELYRLAKKSLDYGEVDPDHHFTHYCRYNYGLVAIAQNSTNGTSGTTSTSGVANGAIIGYLIGKVDDDPDRNATQRKKINIVYWLVVHPDYRRIGIGENLLKQILTVVDTASTSALSTLSTLASPYADKPIYLYVRTKNTAAFELYLKLGFTIVRRILDFYSASDTLAADDAYFMVRSPVLIKVPVPVPDPTPIAVSIPTPTSIPVPTPKLAPVSVVEPDPTTLRIPVTEPTFVPTPVPVPVPVVETTATRKSSVKMKIEEDETTDETIYSSENIPIRPAKKAKKTHRAADNLAPSISSVSLNAFASLASESSGSECSDDDDGK